MTFRGDDRAVTVQIGAVILFGFLVVALSTYQATVVPNQNQSIEFQHNERVQSDMLEVRSAILGTAATGSAAPATVELGTQYPARIVAVNPGPPGGTLSTTSLGNITIKNAVADDATTTGADYSETADFWTGTEPKNYTTKSLEYRPSYANYDDAPTTVYENGLVYNHFPSSNTTDVRTAQSIVSGKRISIVAIDGRLSRGGTRSLSVDPRAVSVSTRTISITDEGGNLSVVIPSDLDAEAWNNSLQETGDTGSDDAYVYDVTPHARGVELHFEPGVTYQLKLSKVGVGSDINETDPAYLTSVDDLANSPTVNRNYSFAVEVRDKYNNPVSESLAEGATNGSLSGPRTITPGRYAYRYRSSLTGADSVRITYADPVGDSDINDAAAFDGNRSENVRYDVSVEETSEGSEASSNTPPTAGFTTDRSGNSDNVDLDATSSSDPDGSIVSYEWDIGADGSIEETGETVNKADVPKGTDIKLIITDNDGATDSITKTVN